MGRSSFRKDLSRSQEAVFAVMDHLIDQGHEVRELEGKEEQAFGDLAVKQAESQLNIEIKYDIMARRTGNLCFEKSNGKKSTGVMTTRADKIFYVVPQGRTKRVFVFDPTKLREYIEASPYVQIKNGGDGKRFILAIVKIDHVVADKLPDEVFEIGASSA